MKAKTTLSAPPPVPFAFGTLLAAPRDAIGRIGKTKTKARNEKKKEEIGWQF